MPRAMVAERRFGPLGPQEEAGLKRTALNLRRHVLRLIRAGESGHAGGALSSAEIVTALFFKIMRLRPQDPSWRERDRFVLSAGHKCLILYAALVERGFMPEEILDTYGALESPLPGHPSMKKQTGVEANTGALGHGLSLAGGMAMGLRVDVPQARVYCLMGDGELAEGSNWEAASACSFHRLENLVAFVDRNGLQISGPTTAVMSYEPLEKRWSAFGWGVETIDGHSLPAIVDAVSRTPFVPGKPSVIIADTVKAKGLSFAEGKMEYHYWKATDAEMEQAERDLAAAAAALEEAGR